MLESGCFLTQPHGERRGASGGRLHFCVREVSSQRFRSRLKFFSSSSTLRRDARRLLAPAQRRLPLADLALHSAPRPRVGASSDLETSRISKTSAEAVSRPGRRCLADPRFGDGSAASSHKAGRRDSPELGAAKFHLTTASSPLLHVLARRCPRRPRRISADPQSPQRLPARRARRPVPHVPARLRRRGRQRRRGRPPTSALGKEGRAPIIKTLPDGFAYEARRRLAILDHRQRRAAHHRRAAAQLYYELGLRLLRRPHPRRMPSLVHHIDFFMPRTICSARAASSAMYQTFLLPRGGRRSRARGPLAARRPSSSASGTATRTDEAYVFGIHPRGRRARGAAGTADRERSRCRRAPTCASSNEGSSRRRRGRRDAAVRVHAAPRRRVRPCAHAAALPAAAARATARSPATASRPATRCPSCVSTRLRRRRTNASTATWRRALPLTRRKGW